LLSRGAICFTPSVTNLSHNGNLRHLSSGRPRPDWLQRPQRAQAKARQPNGISKTIEMPGFSSACLGIYDSLMTCETSETVLPVLGAVLTTVRRICKYFGSRQRCELTQSDREKRSAKIARRFHTTRASPLTLDVYQKLINSRLEFVGRQGDSSAGAFAALVAFDGYGASTYVYPKPMRFLSSGFCARISTSQGTHRSAVSSASVDET
jgi:hypothetical protein